MVKRILKATPRIEYCLRLRNFISETSESSSKKYSNQSQKEENEGKDVKGNDILENSPQKPNGVEFENKESKLKTIISLTK